MEEVGGSSPLGFTNLRVSLQLNGYGWRSQLNIKKTTARWFLVYLSLATFHLSLFLCAAAARKVLIGENRQNGYDGNS